MKRIFLLSWLFLQYACAPAQRTYWQQEVNFHITVSLNDKDYTLDAFETIDYINNSPDTLHFIWFHIWMNAYKNDRTAYSEQMLKQGSTAFYFSKDADKGYINQLKFKVDDATAQVVNDSSNIDIIKVLLPKALPPHEHVTITTPFKIKLPYNFSRGGHVGHDYQVTQWYPKPAVYDRNGWHPMPYLDNGEFFSEFGSYDVEITTPSAYVVAATGVLQDEKTLQELKQNGKHTIEGSTKTWHYKQSNVHDFAWFASKDYICRHDTVALATKTVDVFAFYKPKSKAWDQSIAFAKDGIRKYSGWLGDYPYEAATVVQGSKNDNSGGMEYPTITLITTQEGGRELDATIAHELGHNWFYAALANDERTHAWMDEGINTFYQWRYEAEKYGAEKKPSVTIGNQQERALDETMSRIEKDQPIETPSADFSSANYMLMLYVKAPKWMQKLESTLGKETFDKCMKHYYSEWKFRHPYPEDFKASLEACSGKNLDALFSLLYKTGSLGAVHDKQMKLSLIAGLREPEKYNYVCIAPAFGYNNYDKGMVGGLIHNYQLSFPRLQFIGGALYATGSKKLNAFGHVSYTIYKRRYNITPSLGYISYSINDFVTDDNQKLILRLQRFVPSLRLTLFDKDPHSTRRYTAQWKTFLLTEGALDFKSVDSVNVVSVVNEHSFINRLVLGVSGHRKLFPYSFMLSTDQGKDFIRTGLTGNYFFNYPDGKSGMCARLFAGKFFYTKPKTTLLAYSNDRYFLNLSAPKGYEDYTYSDYFIGRNEFEGWMSQQIMERDGFFKVNTELLGNKVGKTDDWLMSLNLATDLPKSINPLSVLPINIPFKLFADVGTYAEAWKDNTGQGRFVYDAGVQLSLFQSLLNVYVPILYSKVYRDYYKSTITENRFWKTVSFSINISKLQVSDLLKPLPL